MKDMDQQEATDITLQVGGSLWVETLDITIPAKFTSIVTQDDAVWMSQDTNGLYHICLVKNNNNCVIFKPGWSAGELEDWQYFLAVPYQRDDCAETTQDYGMVNTRITVGDADGVILDLVRRFDGFGDFEVTLSQAMEGVPDYDDILEKYGEEMAAKSQFPPLVDDDNPMITQLRDESIRIPFIVSSTTHNRTNFTVTLDSALPFNWDFPYRNVLKAYCCWRFKGLECSYQGNDQTCNHGIADCRAKGNIRNFGGFPGCGNGGLGRL